jgi:cob(I)alamin adenosyltransferase
MSVDEQNHDLHLFSNNSENFKAMFQVYNKKKQKQKMRSVQKTLFLFFNDLASLDHFLHLKSGEEKIDSMDVFS